MFLCWLNFQNQRNFLSLKEFMKESRTAPNELKLAVRAVHENDVVRRAICDKTILLFWRWNSSEFQWSSPGQASIFLGNWIVILDLEYTILSIFRWNLCFSSGFFLSFLPPLLSFSHSFLILALLSRMDAKMKGIQVHAPDFFFGNWSANPWKKQAQAHPGLFFKNLTWYFT